MPDFTYRHTEARDLDDINRVLTEAFTSSDPEDRASIEEWTAGDDARKTLRTLERDGRVIGTTRLIDMGQYFGGKRVGMAGVAGVAVEPESRATGAGRALMVESLREMHASGAPVSVLYASTSAFYRTLGYETAGVSFTHTIPLSLVPRTPQPLRVRPFEEPDHDAVHACYTEYARDKDGTLDRVPYIWNRIRFPKRKPAKGVVFQREGGAIEGYIFHRQRHAPGVNFPMELAATDACAVTPDARDTLFAYLRGYSSMCDRFLLDAGPTHPILLALTQQRAEASLIEHWMLRVIDVRRALEQRGYPRVRDARLCFELDDELLPENAGAWTLAIDDGNASLEQGGTPTLALDVRALGAMYTGFATARDLRTWAALRCDDDATLDLCDALFRGTTPGMAEMF